MKFPAIGESPEFPCLVRSGAIPLECLGLSESIPRLSQFGRNEFCPGARTGTCIRLVGARKLRRHRNGSGAARKAAQANVYAWHNEHSAADRWSPDYRGHATFLPLIRLYRTAMMAITRRTWMKPPMV
jgi:hypothetical protein